MKRSLSTREMQLKATRKYHVSTVNVVSIKKTKITIIGEDKGKGNPGAPSVGK